MFLRGHRARAVTSLSSVPLLTSISLLSSIFLLCPSLCPSPCPSAPLLYLSPLSLTSIPLPCPSEGHSLFLSLCSLSDGVLERVLALACWRLACFPSSLARCQCVGSFSATGGWWSSSSSHCSGQQLRRVPRPVFRGTVELWLTLKRTDGWRRAERSCSGGRVTSESWH